MKRGASASSGGAEKRPHKPFSGLNVVFIPAGASSSQLRIWTKGLEAGGGAVTTPGQGLARVSHFVVGASKKAGWQDACASWVRCGGDQAVLETAFQQRGEQRGPHFVSGSWAVAALAAQRVPPEAEHCWPDAAAEGAAKKPLKGSAQGTSAPPPAAPSGGALLPPPPPTVPLAGRDVPAWGFGTMPLGITYPSGSRPSAEEAKAIVKEALDCGVRLFDTADAYCSGPGDEHYVERLLAEALATDERSSEVVLATKCGMKRTGPNSTGWAPAYYTPAQLEAAVKSCHAALGLGSKPIALWQMHHCDGYGLDSSDPSHKHYLASLGAVKGLIAAGLIERVGLCNCSVRHVEIALEMGVPVASVQNHYSLWDRVAEGKPREKCGKSSKTGIMALCEAKGLAFLAYGALGGVKARDGRAELARDFPALAEMARKKGVSPHALVLAWMRQRWPFLVHIVGSRSREHIRDSVLTPASIRFTESEFRLIEGLKARKA